MNLLDKYNIKNTKASKLIYLRNTLGKLWELPQIIVGFFLIAYFIISGTRYSFEYKGITYWLSDKFPGGISMGTNVFLNSAYDNPYLFEAVVKHEYGHTKQSLYLGPLYLFAIGIPSLILSATTKDISYYLKYPESWADKLGGASVEVLSKRNEYMKELLH